MRVKVKAEKSVGLKLLAHAFDSTTIQKMPA